MFKFKLPFITTKRHNLIVAQIMDDRDAAIAGLREELERKVFTCRYCGHTGSDVLSYMAHVGGRDDLVSEVCCSDISACIERQLERSSSPH